MTSERDPRWAWRSRVLAENPSLKEVVTSLSPMERTAAFAGQMQARQIKQRKGAGGGAELHDEDVLLLLVMQHLHICGHEDTLEWVQRETGVKYPFYNLDSSLLLHYIRDSMKEVDQLYSDLLSFDENASARLEESLYRMRLVADADYDATLGDQDRPLWEEDLKCDANLVFSDKVDGMGVEEVDVPAATVALSSTAGAATAQPIGARVVKAGTLNRLVCLLTSKTSNPEFMKCFLMCHEQFTSSLVVLTKLLERFWVPPDADEYEHAKVVQLNVVNVVKHWLSDYPEDWSPEMRLMLERFALTLDAPETRAFAVQFDTALAKKKVQRAKQFDRNPPKPIVPREIFSSTLQLANVHPEEIARQLSMYEFQIFQNIRPSELLNLAWSKPKLKHKARNVLALIDCFNAFSQWGVYWIMQHDTLEKRAKAVSFIVKLADALYRLNNFDSLMALLAALNSAPIGRLKFTFARLSPSVLEKKRLLESACSRELSYKSYRAAIATANPPVVPYLGLYLTDLVFIEEGNPAHVASADGRARLIHFAKAMHTYRVISNSIQRYQNVPYNFLVIQQIQSLFTKLPSITESEAYRLSLEFEPRGAELADIK